MGLAPTHISLRSYIFVDNSNTFIEGQRAAAIAEGSEVQGKLYRLDFGRLFDFLTSEGSESFFSIGKELYPKLYGSEPPPLDTIWQKLDEMGVGLKIFKRNPRGIEKRVDAALILDLARLVHKLQPKPDGEIIIVAGDADYYDLVAEAKAEGWRVRVTCWRHATAQIVQRLGEFEDLTPHLRDVGYFEKYKFEHNYGEWGTPVDWSKVVPYREPKKFGKKP